MADTENIQKIALAGPIQVNVDIPNFEGKAGKDGRDGRDGDDAYRIAVRNGFFGSEKDWLQSLKGNDGKDGSNATATKARQYLLSKGYFVGDSVDDILMKFVEKMFPTANTNLKPLTFDKPVLGDTTLVVHGEIGYSVVVNGGKAVVLTQETQTIDIPKYGTDNVYLKYYNFVGDLSDSKTIQGLVSGGTREPVALSTGEKLTFNGDVMTIDFTGVPKDYEHNLALFNHSEIKNNSIGINKIKLTSNTHHFGYFNITQFDPSITFELLTPKTICLITEYGTKWNVYLEGERLLVNNSSYTTSWEWDFSLNKYVNKGRAAMQL